MIIEYFPGLDPARPLIERVQSKAFRLSEEDATHVQIIHTNAGYLGQMDNPGHLNYCINGGRYQPYCKGHAISEYGYSIPNDIGQSIRVALNRISCLFYCEQMHFIMN